MINTRCFPQVQLGTWSQHPPIKALEATDVQDAVLQLIKDIEIWKDGLDPAKMEFSEANTWTARFKNSMELLDYIETIAGKCSEEEHNFFYAYYLNDVPLGFVALEFQDQLPYIAGIVTHPGSANVGGALIEKVVEHADNRGYGQVMLYPTSEAARNAYTALGFKNYCANQDAYNIYDLEMCLDWAESDLWHYSENRWQLKKFEGEQFLA
jgi:GNAT superfamily N-acetyltransferase